MKTEECRWGRHGACTNEVLLEGVSETSGLAIVTAERCECHCHVAPIPDPEPGEVLYDPLKA